MKKQDIPQDIQNAYYKYASYSSKLDFNPYNNPTGKKAHCSKLYNRFYDLCQAKGFDSLQVSWVLSDSGTEVFFDFDKK